MKVGDVVQDFELPDERGVTRSLAEFLRHGPVVLFFYPAAFTPLCTIEACHFRDVAGEFAALGAQAVGVSADLVERQAAFAQAHSLGFPLLADPAGRVRAQFGVRRGLALAPTKRVTFVVDTDRRVAGVVRSEIRMNSHADRALDVLRQGNSSAPSRMWSWWRPQRPSV
jgi:thioredoxin-dependent peroxiredoxin